MSGRDRHTPGPWRWEGDSLRPVEPNPQSHAVHTIFEAMSGSGFLVSDYRATNAEIDADRVLVAAAPELLDALRDLVAGVPDTWSLPGAGMEAAVAAARRAVAKATGDRS